MDVVNVLVDAFDRIREVVGETVDGLDAEELAFRAHEGSNSIAWLVWHLTRVQDDHVAAAAASEQVWTARGWAERFGLPLDEPDTGYGHGAHEVGLVRAEAALLTGYHDAVHQRTVEYLRTLAGDDLERIVDRSWDPPVTLGTRLVSVISDDLQHAGQAAFVRGLVERAH